jgi:tocopherol O-methyltransferase
MTTNPRFPVEIEHIRKHYDRLSFLYRFFWGEHIHHGYWDADQTPAAAQIRLMERLAEEAHIPRGSKVLDIGCGLGGSAFWLADQFGCDVTGMTISPVQARMANQKAKARGLNGRVRVEIADANEWRPAPTAFDVIWIMESSEHFRDKQRFFQQCAIALKRGGILAVCAWLRRDGPPESRAEEQLVAAIGMAMLSASLDGLSDYVAWMHDAGLRVRTAQDITRHVEPTWDQCAQLAQRPLIKHLLRFTSRSTQRFVASFPLMQRAYATGAMAFGLLVATKSAREG